MSRPARPAEKIADTIVHVLGMTSGFVAACGLLVWAARALPIGSTLTLSVYCAGLMAMLCCSGAYHMSRTVAWKGTLRRMDHAAIFLKIAGTYTPFALLKLGGVAGLALFAVVWGVALAGAAAKLLLAARWDGIAIVLYLGLGWSGVAAFGPLTSALPTDALVLLGIGGVVYSLGVIFFLWQSLPFHNAVWHVFVLVGTACHFAAVTTAVAG